VQLQEIPADPELRRQWNELALQMERPQVFYTWEWAFAMQSAYGNWFRPWLFLAYEGSELVGVVSLATRDGNSEVSFLAATTSDYCDFVSRPDRHMLVVEAVLGELRVQRRTRLVLASIPDNSPTVPALRAAAASHGFHIFCRPAQVCAQVLLGDADARREMKTGLLASKKVRRQVRNLESQGAIRVSHLRTWDEVRPALEGFANTHVGRFLATQRLSNLMRQDRRDFLSELARLLSNAGWLCLSHLSLAGRPIAWNYGFRFGGSWFWYLPTFESQMAAYSPGLILLSNIVADACNVPELDVVDLGVGSEGYKERFSTSFRSTLDFSLNQSKTRHASEIVRFRTVATIKKSPRLESAIRRIVGRLKSIRTRYWQGGILSLLGRGVRRVCSSIFSSTEVVFSRWAGEKQPIMEGLTLRPLDLETLSTAAMTYADDDETITYLLRAAQRLTARKEEACGFVLFAEETPVHFCWVSDFEGFSMDELKVRLVAPSSDAVLIVDCWTPGAVRGKGYYGQALAALAARYLPQSRTPWIFSVAANQASIRGIEKTDFQRAYSLVRRKSLFSGAVRQIALPQSIRTEKN